MIKPQHIYILTYYISLVKQLVLIIGASSGIGAKTYELCSRYDEISVVGVARRKRELDILQNKWGGTVYQGNVTDEESINTIMKTTDPSQYERFSVLYCAGLHEESTITDNGVKRFVTREDFSAESGPYAHDVETKTRTVNVEGVKIVAQALTKNMPSPCNIDFTYISSRVAENPSHWSVLGNPFYAEQKADAETILHSYIHTPLRIRILRFGLVGETMGKQVLTSLQGVDPSVHQENNLSLPLKPYKELVLPLRVLCQDIVSLLRGGEHHFVYSGKNTYTYALSPREAHNL